MDHCSHTPCEICDRRIAELEAECEAAVLAMQRQEKLAFTRGHALARLRAELAITANALNVANHALGLAAPKVRAKFDQEEI